MPERFRFSGLGDMLESRLFLSVLHIYVIIF